MSIEQAKACIEKMKFDKVFREYILSIEDTEARMRAIHDAGFSITMEEIREASREMDHYGDISGSGMDLDNNPSGASCYCFLLG
ncbi:MAG: Nif11-like leader peptide family natural product precursor [Chlorobium sp.]|nr:MAG: Nif11-like leader peptide family natural product precursor [Chlorobium sp.]